LSRFGITGEEIPERILIENEAAGALATFVGIVRNHNEGRPVQALEYEAYPELAVKEGERIVVEALGRFPILDAACVHRIGSLQIGDVAIRVEAVGAHRSEAFRACEWIVEEVKRRVPIWKREVYADGESGWVNATTPGVAEVTEAAYYARQRSLPEVDQTQLKAARVLMVGAGGLGCPALLYLAGAGVGRITIVDPDRVEVSNLHRQVLYGIDDLGMPKATAAARRLRALNPLIEIEAVEDRVDSTSAMDLVEAHDLVLDGTDRLDTKFLLNRVCVGLDKPLIVASVHRFEGQLQVVTSDGPCLQCLWPEPPEDGCVGTCAETGVLGITPGLLGAMQAAESIKLLLSMSPPEGILLVDLLRSETRRLKLARRDDCPICGHGADPLAGIDVEPLEIDGLSSWCYAVDIREPGEVMAHASDLPNIPMSAWVTPVTDRPLLLVCASGRRSLSLAKQLRRQGVQAYSLAGGVRKI
jgi:adenylyltransferase/sulfurtransferase